MTSFWVNPSTLFRSGGNGSGGNGSAGNESTGEGWVFEESHSEKSPSRESFSGGSRFRSSVSSGSVSEGSAPDGSPYINFPFGGSKDPKRAFSGSYEERLKARLLEARVSPPQADTHSIEVNGIKSNQIGGNEIKSDGIRGNKADNNEQLTKSKDSTRVMIDLGKAGSSIKTDLAKLKINQLKYDRSLGNSEMGNIVSECYLPATPMSFKYLPYQTKISSVLANLQIYNKGISEGEDKSTILKTLKNIYPLLLTKYQKIKGSKPANILLHDLMVWHFINKFKKELFCHTNFWANHPDAHMGWLMGKQNFALKGFIQRKIAALPFCVLFYIMLLVLLPISLVTKTKIRWRLKPSQLDFERKGLKFLFTTTSGVYFLLGFILRAVVISFTNILYYLCKTPREYKKLIFNRYFVRIFNFMYKIHFGEEHQGKPRLPILRISGFYNYLSLPFSFKRSSNRVNEFDYITTPKIPLREFCQLVDFKKSAHSLNTVSIDTKKDYIQKLGVSYGALKTKNSFINMGQILVREPAKGATTIKSHSSNSRNSAPYRYKPHSLKPYNSKPYFVFFDQYENIPSVLRRTILEDIAWAAKKAGALLVLKPHPTYPKRWLDSYLKQATSISDVIVPFRKTGRYLKKDFSLAKQSWGLISFYSTSLLKAVLSHKPAIAYNYTSQENYSVVDAYDNGVCFDVRQKEQLATVMADILAQGPMFRAQHRARQKFFETYPYYADGCFYDRQDKLHRKLSEVAL